jgi:hypothetical protein
MTIKLPLVAKDLVEAAQAQLNEESEQVRAAMIDSILPKAIDSIFTFDAKSRELIQGKAKIDIASLIPEITQTLWSYPGSFGASRICKTLELEGFTPDEADQLTESILNYTRYPMSIVNFMRHLGSSINSVRNIWNEPRVSETVLSELGYATDILPGWYSSIKSVDVATIRDDQTFRSWLQLVEDHLRTYMAMQVRINRYTSGRPIPPLDDRPRLAESSLVRAYVRRFGNYVAAHAGLTHQSTRTDGAAATVKDEYEKLLKTFTQGKKEIFEVLEADFQARSRRISASVRRPSLNQRPKPLSSQSGIEQNLNINGKKVEIRTSKASLPNSLVEQFIKSFNLQYNLDPNQPVISSRMLADGDFIEVEVERPEKSDMRKIQAFIESMYL